MSLYAVFLHQRFGYFSWSRARYVGHIYGPRAADAVAAARRQFNVRSCDAVVVRPDGGRCRRYGIRGAYPHVTSRFL